MFNLILTTGAAASGASLGILDIIALVVIALGVIGGFIAAFASGKLTLKKIIKNPAILKETYDDIMKTLDKKINKATKNEIKAIKKEDPEKADKYHIQRTELIEAKEKLLEPAAEEPKLDKE